MSHRYSDANDVATAGTTKLLERLRDRLNAVGLELRCMVGAQVLAEWRRFSLTVADAAELK